MYSPIHGPKEFTVKAIRNLITCSTIAPGNQSHNSFKWNNRLPIRININSWRIANNGVPTQVNLDARGVDLDSTRCPCCDLDQVNR